MKNKKLFDYSWEKNYLMVLGDLDARENISWSLIIMLVNFSQEAQKGNVVDIVGVNQKIS